MKATEWIIDALGCDARRLTSVVAMREVCDRVIADLQLHVVGRPQWHAFPDPGGVTGIYLLSESHLACHTYPEHGIATWNLYCCRDCEPWDWRGALTDYLGAGEVSVRAVSRGDAPSAVGVRERRPA